MLRFPFTGVLAVLLTTSALPVRAAEANKDAKAIIARAIEVKGGAANVAKYKASSASVKGTLFIGGMAGEISGTAKDQAPDKHRLEVSIRFGGQENKIVQVVNGDKGWEKSDGKTAEMDKEGLEEAREELYAGEIEELRGLNGKGIQLSLVGDSKVDGKSAVGVRVSSAGHRDVSLYFDKENGLLIKSETKGKEGGSEYNEEIFYSDYKKVSGLMVHHKEKVLRNGKPFMNLEMTSVTPAEKFDDKEFAKP
jgi:hypothetical protein